MYSLVLMTAMAGSGDIASFGGRNMGCNGCSGAVVVSSGCSGSCHGARFALGCNGSSCHGMACNGCTGSSCHGWSRPSLFRGHNSCHGCTGSSCHGGRGWFGNSCHGCSGASCHGGMGSSCHGCMGSSCLGTMVTPAVVMPAMGSTPATTSMAPASIQLNIPATATLTVDGAVITGQGELRQFHTPALTIGQQYYYDMTAQMIVNGQPEVQTLRVLVTAGETVSARFDTLIVKSAATVAVK
jgi:uncharacterized protein (TIGR03000 family)